MSLSLRGWKKKQALLEHLAALSLKSTSHLIDVLPKVSRFIPGFAPLLFHLLLPNFVLLCKRQQMTTPITKVGYDLRRTPSSFFFFFPSILLPFSNVPSTRFKKSKGASSLPFFSISRTRKSSTCSVKTSFSYKICSPMTTFEAQFLSTSKVIGMRLPLAKVQWVWVCPSVCL